MSKIFDDNTEYGHGADSHTNFCRNKWTWRHQLRRLFWLILIPLGLLLPKLCERYPNEIEDIYSRTIYPVVSGILGSISSYVKSSAAELLILCTVAVLILIFIVRLFILIFGKLHRRHYNRIRFFSYLISLGIFAGIMLNLFYAVWGLNHFREPVAYSLGLTVQRFYSVDELAAVYESLAMETAQLRTQVEENENGIFSMGNIEDAYASVVNAYEKLGEVNAAFSNVVYHAKSVHFSKEMSKLGISGIYIPYTAEMNINIDQPDLYIPATAAHETAHYMGFAREDEANFIAFYVSTFSSEPALRYSAAMNALVNCGNALCEQDSERYLEIRNRIYTDEMNRDLTDYRNHIAKYADEKVQQLSDNMNDAYLKHNGQTEGIESYGRMVDLLLAYYDSKGVLG